MYKFTIDFNAGKPGPLDNFNFIFQTMGVPSTIVEIGVFEGYTTLWLNDNLHQYNENLKIYAIDPHLGSIDMLEKPEDVKEMFLHNVNASEYKHIEYIPKKSVDGLLELIQKNVKAQLIYIDGDHFADTVLTDLVLSFQLLEKGGVILCDDATTWQYVDKNNTKSAQMSPRLAIESFITCNWHNVHPIKLPDSSQTAFIKLC